MYLILEYLSYALLGIFSVLLTTYLIPIYKLFNIQINKNIKIVKKSNNINNTKNYNVNNLLPQLPIYIGFITTFILLYLSLNLLKTITNDFILGFLILLLFCTLIIHSVLLILDITFIELLNGIKIKKFKYNTITAFFFGMKFSLLQILCNPLFFIILIIQILSIGAKLDSLIKTVLYLLGLIITVHILSNISDKSYTLILNKFLSKQNSLNIISSITTVIISFIFILDYI